MRKIKHRLGWMGTDMNEEEAINRITKLLEQGCTMLAAHHDCGAPLFRCEGELICPICSFEKAEASPQLLAAGSDLAKTEEAVSEARFQRANQGKRMTLGECEEVNSAQRSARGNPAENLEGQDASAPVVVANASEASKLPDNLRAAQKYLTDSLLRRLRILTEEMEKEQDLGRLKKQLECIEGLVRVLKALAG